MKVYIVEFEVDNHHSFLEVAASLEAAQRFVEECVDMYVRGTHMENDDFFRRVRRNHYTITEHELYA